MKTMIKIAVTSFLLMICAYAQAGVVIGGTRLIYDGGSKESSISVANPDSLSYLIQSWVDNPDGVSGKAPFTVTPPLFRLDGDGRENVLRVVRTGGNLPEDKESLFWLNIKSIPSSKKAENSLQIAVKTRIKLIYRPADLGQTLEAAAEGMKWRKEGSSLVATNASPFYITFFSVTLNGAKVSEATMLPPGGNMTFKLPAGARSGTLSWKIINDYGGISKVYSTSL